MRGFVCATLANLNFQAAQVFHRMIREFNLSKSGDKAQVKILGVEHIAQVLALQHATRASLSDEQKMFVLPQSNEYFARFLEKRNGLMVGVVCNGQLISQIVLMGPITLEDAIARNAITRNEIPFHHAQSADLIVVAKSMAVHPEWRGNELSQLMLEAALDQPLARTADHVFAQISADNVRSWELFMRNGFGIVAAAIDPLDNQPRFVMQKPALGLALHSTPSVDNINPLEQFSTILRVTGLEALIGQLGPRDSTLSLSFFAGQATAAAWTEEVANA